MKITATIEASPAGPGIWFTNGSTNDVALESPLARTDLPSILLIRDGTFESDTRTLAFDFRSAHLLVGGNESRGTLIIETNPPVGAPVKPPTPRQTDAVRIDGEKAYRLILQSMTPQIMRVGEDILDRIRELDPEGRLERHGRRFINRPDNFVALEPQTRINEIIVHVRGIVSPQLRRVATQRGYSAFKVKSPEDFLEAGRALASATRKF